MYHLTVTIHGNPDYNQGDWKEDHTISATNIMELRKSVFVFQGNNDIGGGNWGKATLSKDGKIVGYMSYNGRVWDKPYWDGGANEVIL